MGGRADEDEFGNAPEPVAPAEYIRALAAYQARRGGRILGGNRRYQDAGLTGAFRGCESAADRPPTMTPARRATERTTVGRGSWDAPR